MVCGLASALTSVQRAGRVGARARDARACTSRRGGERFAIENHDSNRTVAPLGFERIASLAALSSSACTSQSSPSEPAPNQPKTQASKDRVPTDEWRGPEG